ncbi:MAG: N-acetylmuramic acid 6-phosphate etherase [Phycisphaerae bacterium]|nr:N-acetylmuramic acid 6-phosphate etherase [Phycisphaerae bacterium]
MDLVDRGHLLTEQRNPRSADIDRMSIADAFDVMNGEDASVAQAVARCKPDICQAVERVVAAFRHGGRLFYLGAGTSGRLGVLDAAECPPTFLTNPTMVQGIIAGGETALRRPVEGAEDDVDAARCVIDERKVGPHDVVMGIASGGTTPFVHAALARARQLGAATIFLACVPPEEVPDDADVSIRVLAGPEVVTGSTRLKAGTATKMVLNTITTLALIQTGKVHGNLMVDVDTRTNVKLVDRAIRIIGMETGLGRQEAHALLRAAGGRAKIAVVMHHRNVDAAGAERLLQQHDGMIHRVLGTD